VNQQRTDVAALIESCAGGRLPARYCAFFKCFNRQWFFEAHEVLEVLWLAERSGPDADFFKALIQLAAAFVHVQKGRPGPAKALFRLAQAHLCRFPGVHLTLDTSRAQRLITEWLETMEAEGQDPNRPLGEAPPQLNPGLTSVGQRA